jgi:excisionase family DNA binding protein
MNQSTESPRLAHSIPEAAAILGVGRTTLYGLIDTGEITTVTIGRRRLVRHSDLVAYVEGLRSGRAA